MIFGSRKRGGETSPTDDAATTTAEPDDSTTDAAVDAEVADDEAVEDRSAQDQAAQDRAADESVDGEVDIDELDGQDWRDLGPYDITEVDADVLENDHEVARIDLGSMVLTPINGCELRLQVDEKSQTIVSAMMILPDSALEVGAFAAPRSGGLWTEIREELMQNAEAAGGSANLVRGPLGVELRRLLPVRTPDGREGYQASRMWVAEGPRWMLRGVIYGHVAVEDGLDLEEQMLEAFRQVVVRRGDEAMAPGDLLPLQIPDNMTRKSPNPERSGQSTGE